MNSTDEFTSLAEKRLLSTNSETVLVFFAWLFFELIYPTLYGESSVNIYVLLSDEHYVLI